MASKLHFPTIGRELRAEGPVGGEGGGLRAAYTFLAYPIDKCEELLARTQ